MKSSNIKTARHFKFYVFSYLPLTPLPPYKLKRHFLWVLGLWKITWKPLSSTHFSLNGCQVHTAWNEQVWGIYFDSFTPRHPPLPLQFSLDSLTTFTRYLFVLLRQTPTKSLHSTIFLLNVCLYLTILFSFLFSAWG